MPEPEPQSQQIWNMKTTITHSDRSAHDFIIAQQQNLCENESILFIDSDSLMVDIQYKILKRYGYVITPSIATPDALNKFKARPWFFDIIICEMAMPVMTGLVLANKIKQIAPHIPIILSMGSSMLLGKTSCLYKDIDGFLIKPFTSTESMQLIRRLLDKL